MRLHRSTIVGMAVAALLALLVLGPVSFAVLSMRSRPESTGATTGAWITVGIVLLLVMAGAALAGGALVVLARTVRERMKRSHAPAPSPGDGARQSTLADAADPRLEPVVARIAAALARLMDPDVPESAAVLGVRGRESVYLQFTTQDDGGTILAETVSNTYLDPAEQLTPAQMEQLNRDGWHSPDGEAFHNFHRAWPARDAHERRQIALDAVRVLRGTFGVTTPDDITIDVFH